MQDASANQAASGGYGPKGRTLLAVSKYLAIAGGLVFVALVGMELKL